jgi:ACS family tartrate transporter-like MFS transporter
MSLGILPVAVAATPDPDDTALARSTMRRVSGRLLPFLTLLFLFSWVDRTNVGIAALQMNRDLRFSPMAYGLGAGIFFLGYALFEIPSNLILARVGARRWIARIAISWGLLASAMMFVRTPWQFYGLRFVLGVAEAGYMPGIIYYLSLWFPARERGLTTARFLVAMPLSAVLGGPLGGWLLGLDGRFGLHGWQWVFLVEGIPPVVLGIVALRLLTDRPEDAQWLSAAQRTWLVQRLHRDTAESTVRHEAAPLRAIAHPVVWLLAGTHFLMAVPIYAYTFWAPLVIRDAVHASAVSTGLILGAIGCLAAIAMLASGAHSDRTRERPVHASAGALLAAIGCAGAALIPQPVGRISALALVEIGARSYNAPFWCLPPILLRGSGAAAGIALVNAVFSIGGFVGPSLTGWFKDATGSTSGAFLVLTGVSLSAAALCLVLRQQPAFTVRTGGSACRIPSEPAAMLGGQAAPP